LKAAGILQGNKNAKVCKDILLIFLSKMPRKTIKILKKTSKF